MKTSLVSTLATGFVGAVAGAAATISVGAFGYLNKDRELDIRMVDIGLSILSGENKGTDSEPGRRFALRLLERYTEIDIPDEDFKAWIKRGVIDVSPLPTLLLQQRSEIRNDLRELEASAQSLLTALKNEEQGVGGRPAGRGPRWAELRKRYHVIKSDLIKHQAQLSEIERSIQKLDEQIGK